MKSRILLAILGCACLTIPPQPWLHASDSAQSPAASKPSTAPTVNELSGIQAIERVRVVDVRPHKDTDETFLIMTEQVSIRPTDSKPVMGLLFSTTAKWPFDAPAVGKLYDLCLKYDQLGNPILEKAVPLQNVTDPPAAVLTGPRWRPMTRPAGAQTVERIRITSLKDLSKNGNTSIWMDIEQISTRGAPGSILQPQWGTSIADWPFPKPAVGKEYDVYLRYDKWGDAFPGKVIPVVSTTSKPSPHPDTRPR